jgi:hypothetical protein
LVLKWTHEEALGQNPDLSQQQCRWNILPFAVSQTLRVKPVADQTHRLASYTLHGHRLGSSFNEVTVESFAEEAGVVSDERPVDDEGLLQNALVRYDGHESLSWSPAPVNIHRDAAILI